jgi:hypothetical protein
MRIRGLRSRIYRSEVSDNQTNTRPGGTRNHSGFAFAVPPRARQLAQINTYLRVFMNSAIDLASASVTPTMPLL